MLTRESLTFPSAPLASCRQRWMAAATSCHMICTATTSSTLASGLDDDSRLRFLTPRPRPPPRPPRSSRGGWVRQRLRLRARRRDQHLPPSRHSSRLAIQRRHAYPERLRPYLVVLDDEHV